MMKSAKARAATAASPTSFSPRATKPKLSALEAMESLVKDFYRLLTSKQHRSSGVSIAVLTLSYQEFFRRNHPPLVNFGCRNSDAFARLLCANHPQMFRRGEGNTVHGIPDDDKGPAPGDVLSPSQQPSPPHGRLGAWKPTGNKTGPWKQLEETEEELSRRVELLRMMEELKNNPQILERPRIDEENRRSQAEAEATAVVGAAALEREDNTTAGEEDDEGNKYQSIEFAERIRDMDLGLLPSAFEVTLTTIHSIDRFYCQFSGLANPEALRRLEMSMEAFYESADNDAAAGDERLLTAVSVGTEAWRLPPITIVAHRYRGKHGSTWRRGMVLSRGVKHDACTVLHFDYGTETEAEDKDLRYLLRYFVELLPNQASRCHLGCVKPPNQTDPKTDWPRKSEKKFVEINKELRGKLIGVVLDEDRSLLRGHLKGPGLILYECNVEILPKLGRCINKELVDKELAEDVPERFVFPIQIKAEFADPIKRQIHYRKSQEKKGGAAPAAAAGTPTTTAISPIGDGK